MSRIPAGILFWALGLALACGEDERIWVDAKVNAQPVRMIFDTGCDRLVLFNRAAVRLGLEVTGPAQGMDLPAGSPLVGITEACSFTLWNKTARVQFSVLDTPDLVNFRGDGLIGWSYLEENILEFDAANHHLSVGIKPSKKVSGWLKLPIIKKTGCLVLGFPRSGGGQGTVTIDTGSTGEISLSSKNWQKWKTDHPSQPATLTAYYMPGAGTVIREVMWAKKIKLGPLQFSNVLIKEANVAEVAGGGPATFEASLPLDVLRQQDMIVDGKNGFAYLSPKKIAGPLPPYNRLGAVFAPRAPRDDDLAANVAPGSPAEKAGIQNGDILLKVGTHDVTEWRAHPPETPTSLQFERPEGTKLELTLRRGRSEYHTVAVLKDILDPKNTGWLKDFINQHLPWLNKS